jgi:acyl-CoA synthetase (AMP-forming)/AMP-acid ligase II
MKSNTLIDLLQLRSQQFGSEPKYLRLNSALEVEERLSFAELEQGARGMAHDLRNHTVSGDRALLTLPSSIDFLKAFFGCLYARTIPVPVCPPRPNRSFDVFSAIAEDSGASVVMTGGPVPTIRRLDGAAPRSLAVRPAEDIAFLQYTSGATAAPKGVIITHQNVLSNCAYIQAGFHHDPNTVALTWLPHYHDMGLIAGLLQPLYIGHACYLMPAMSFLQQPVRWLRAISTFRVDHSGAPTFAYRLCCDKVDVDEIPDVDLGCWRTAYVGAEPIQADALERFAGKFGLAGFRRSSFYPAYGLAEATLKVTGGQAGEGPTYSRTIDRKTGCGRPSDGTEVVIVDPETEIPAVDGETGEIWVRGPGVAQGYWGCEPQVEDGGYLRTGDLGMMIDGELFVTGRLRT